MKHLIMMSLVASTLCAKPLPQHPDGIPQKNAQAILIRKQPKQASNVIFLISFPRSGQNWTKCLMQIMGGRPILPLCGTFGLENPLKLEISTETTPCFVMHNPHWIDGAPSDCNKLVVIVRNYKECFLREAIADKVSCSANKAPLLRTQGLSYPDLYFDILKRYDAWQPSNRHLMYYEDLLKDPASTLNKLRQFLGDSEEGYQNLINNFEFYRELTIQYYNERQGRCGGSMSRGTNEHYHSQNQSKEDLLMLDQIMQEKNPDLWGRYLSHYAL